MDREKRRSRSLWAVALLAALFALSFVLFDRLLFLGLREGVARYMSSAAVQSLHWTPARGQGEGTALILGTSRAEYGFNAEVLSEALGRKVLNEAGPGRYPQFQYHLYRSYQAAFPAPALVLYGVDYFMFEKNSTGLGLVRVDKKGLLEKLRPDGAANPASPVLSRLSWLFRTKPAFDDLAAGFWGFDADGVPAAGGTADLKPASKRKPRIGKGVFVEKPRRWKKRTYVPFPGAEGAFFERLLADLDREGVPTFLVFIPEYIGTYETNSEQSRFKADIGRLASGLKNVRILDFDRPESFDLTERKMFWNGGWGYSNSHLSERGADRFSALLGAAVREALDRRPEDR